MVATFHPIPSSTLVNPATTSTTSHNGCTTCFSMQESISLMRSLVSKSELSLRADLNSKISRLEKKVSDLTDIINSLSIVWGTQRRCTALVVHKALLPNHMWSSTTVKSSLRRRGPSFLWWHTIIAPSAVMDQIDKVWHILEAKPSWSLRNSLSTSRDQRRRPAPPISKSQDNFPPTNLHLPSAPPVSSLLPPALILLTLFCPLSLPRPLPPPLPSQPYPKGPMPNLQPQSTPL